MAKGHQKNTNNKTEQYDTFRTHRYPITASLGYSNTAEAQENDLKSNLIKMIEAFKEEIYP